MNKIMEKIFIDMNDVAKNETFCESIGCVKNEHGTYIYKSANDVHLINLPCILEDYKDWLIKNNILKK